MLCLDCIERVSAKKVINVRFRCIILVLFLINSSLAEAQNEASKWYFGLQAGLDFMTVPPTPLVGAMSTQEGCASISNASGALLFYTDGITIYNQNHLVMANGTGLFGSGSSTQSGVIVKQPGNPNIYYVFTADFIAGPNGIRYSVVDMSLAAGIGSVTTKNVLLHTPSTEKITAVRHCNGTDVWVITHDYNSNVFRTFLVTSLGVNTTPILSAVGSVHSNMIGNLKVSGNGRKLGLAIYTINSSFELYDFDNSTGVVSNPIVLGTSYTLPYGCEFSPNGRIFYGCNATASNSGTIYQWNLCAGSNSAIVASQSTVAAGNVSFGSMQLAPDGKIYVARWGTNALAVINNPNTLGIGCNVVNPAITLAAGTTCRFGLPNFITSFLNTPSPPFTHTINPTLSCLNASFTAPPTETCGSSSYTVAAHYWNFGDPSSGSANTSTISNPTHSFSAPGTYTTQLIIQYTCGADTLRQPVTIPMPTLQVQTTSVICGVPGSATVQVFGGFGPFTYSWAPAASTSSIASNLNAGSQTVTVSGLGSGCTFTASGTVGVLNSFTLSQNSSTPTCNGANTASAGVAASGGSGTYTYSWIGSSQNTPTIVNIGSGSYTVFVTDVNSACTLSSTFSIVQPPALTLNISASSPSACVSHTVGLTSFVAGGSPPYNLLWSNSSTSANQVLSATLAGIQTHTLTVIDTFSCSANASVSVSFVAHPTLTVGNQTICLNTTATLSAFGASNYTWLPGNYMGSNYTVSPNAFSTYTVVGMSLGCNSTLVASVDVKPYPTFNFVTASITCASLGSATVNTSGGIGPFSYLWNPTQQTDTIALSLFPGNYSLTVFDQGTACSYTHTTYFAPLVPFTGTVSATPSLACHGVNTASAEIALSGGSGKQSYIWLDLNGAQTDSVATDLAAGVNTVQVTDSLTFCMVTHTFLVTQPAAFTLNIVASSPSVCLGSQINLSAINSGGTPAYTYTWSNEPPSSNLVVQETSVGAKVYTVNSTDANSCAVSNTISLEFVENPTVTVSSVSICPLQTGTLSAIGAASYTWSTGSTNSSVTLSPNSNTTYTVIGNAKGCTDTATAEIFLYPLPPVVFTHNSPICENDSLLLSGTGGAAFFWQTPSGFSSTFASVYFSSASPTLSGFYTLTATSVFGCTASVTQSLVVYPTPLLVASGATACVGESFSLTANFLNGASYQWLASNFNSTQQNPIVAMANQNMNGSYSVVITSAVGCTNSSVVNVSVAVKPVVTVVADSSLCQGDQLNLKTNQAGNYAWTGPLNFYSTVQNPTLSNVSLMNAGIYSLTLSSGPCTVSAVKTISVFATPSINPSSNSPFCENSNIQLTTNAGLSYTWTGPSNFSSTNAISNIPSANINNAGTYSLIARSPQGCLAFGSVTVQMLNAPQITVNNASICIGGILTLTASGGDVFQWKGPQNYSASGPSLHIINASAQYLGTYTVSVSNSNLCTSSRTVSVMGLPFELPNVNIVGNSKGCIGKDVNLIGSGGGSYQWSGPGNFSSVNKDLNFVASSYSMSGIYTLTVKNNSNCATSKTVAVNIYKLPEVDVVVSHSTQCVPFCATIQTKAKPNFASLQTVNYGIEDKFYPVANLRHCFSTPGNYFVTVNYTDLNTCANSTTVNISGYEKPNADFEFTPNEPVAGIDEVHFYNTSAGLGALTYTWYFLSNDTITSNEKNPLWIFDKAGVFPTVLKINNQWGCADTVVKILVVNDELQFYIPNTFTPNGDGLNDLFIPKGQGVKDYLFQIFNRWGELIFESENFENGWDGTCKGKESPIGTYAWKLTYKGSSAKEIVRTGNVNLLR